VTGYRRGSALALLGATMLAVLVPGVRATPGAAAQDARRAPVEKSVTAKKYAFDPPRIDVQQDDIVKITFKTDDIPHSFTIDKPYLIAKRATPGHPIVFEFRADQPGTFTYYCNITTDDGCRQMRGELVVHARR
jgi:heme/copper-type cytochrome/quinol oxidase subunit 2